MRNNRIASEMKLIARQVLVIALLNIAIIVAAGQSSNTTKGVLSVDRSLDQPPVLEHTQDAIKLATDLVNVVVTVTDRSGKAIDGLQKESFRVSEDKVEQPISFFSEEDTPVSVGIVFDTSGSMSDGTIERAKEALARFIQTSHPQDEFSLIGFSSSPQLLLDRVRDRNAVLDRVTYVQPTGETALYDAVYMGIEKVTQGVYPKQAIILISDGEENSSRCSFSKLRRKLQESGVIVYTVRVGMLPLPKPIGGMVMDQVAAASGGKSFSPKNSERMNETFEQIALELRRQYSIGYLPSNFVADGKLHRIKVSLTVPRELSREMVVRHREGDYAIAKLPAR